MPIHRSAQNSDVSLSQEFQKHLSNASHKPGIFDYGKHNKGQVKIWGQTYGITCKHMKMLSTNILKYIVLQTSFLYWNSLVHTTNHIVYAD